MSQGESWSARRTRAMNRFHARLASLARPATGFVSQPEPRTIGSYPRGRQLAAGNFLFSGYLVEAPEVGIWDLPMPDAVFETELHGFTWLDDLAAVGDTVASQRAQDWTHEWVARFGSGQGPGWTPDLTGRRLIRWINHAILILNGSGREVGEAYFRSLARQTIFLSRRWRAASPGLPRFEALTGLVYAGLALTGMDRHVGHAMRALSRECAAQIDRNGALSTRNPEELLEVFTLLNWASEALAEAGGCRDARTSTRSRRSRPRCARCAMPTAGWRASMAAVAALEGRLEQALAASGVRVALHNGLAMGFARLAHGRTSVIVDAAPPPPARSLGERPCLDARLRADFGPPPGDRELRLGRHLRAKLAAGGARHRFAFHARDRGVFLVPPGRAGIVSGAAPSFWSTPPRRPLRAAEDPLGTILRMGHDGYLPTHGLTHVRNLQLTFDGRGLTGEDALVALGAEGERLRPCLRALEVGGHPLHGALPPAPGCRRQARHGRGGGVAGPEKRRTLDLPGRGRRRCPLTPASISREAASARGRQNRSF